MQLDYIIINNHRYRQRTFIKRCIQYLWKKNIQQQQQQQQTPVFMAHIDTDEYIIINPLLRRPREKPSSKKKKEQKDNDNKGVAANYDNMFLHVLHLVV